MNGAPAWWRSRTPREQRLLLAMGALAAIVFAWLLVIRPLGDALSTARERHGEAVLALAQVRSDADELRRLQVAQPAALGMALESFLTASASAAGFRVARGERQGALQATLAFASVRPQAFFGWVDQLERERGLIVERLVATTNNDQTLSVEIAFRSRAS